MSNSTKTTTKTTPKTLEQVLRDKLKYSFNKTGPISINVTASQVGECIYLKLYGVRLPFWVKGDRVEMVEE